MRPRGFSSPVSNIFHRGILCPELELNFALLAKMRPDVAAIAEQPPAVTYIDDHGRERRHTFDFKLRMMDGTSGLVAVKPFALVDKTGIGRTVELIAEQVPPALAKLLLGFRGETTIGELASKSGLAGYGFDAVVSAIADGKLRLLEYGMLDDQRVVAGVQSQEDRGDLLSAWRGLRTRQDLTNYVFYVFSRYRR